MFRFDKEIKYFHPYYIDPFKYKSAFGHMSQVAWAKSDKLGCGLAHFNVSTCRYKIFYKLQNLILQKAICGDSFPYSTVVVCNYGPQGNVIGGTMYEKGDPCTSCASYDVHCYNHGLCGPQSSQCLDVQSSLPLAFQLVLIRCTYSYIPISVM